MIFNQNYEINIPESLKKFTIDKEAVELAEQYKYLGSIISSKTNDIFKPNYSLLRGKALRAIAALRQNIKTSICTPLSFDLLFKSFDVQIRPIVDYGAELWCQVKQICDIE